MPACVFDFPTMSIALFSFSDLQQHNISEGGAKQKGMTLEEAEAKEKTA